MNSRAMAGSLAFAAWFLFIPAATAQYKYDLKIKNIQVTVLQDGSKQVSWTPVVSVPPGMPAIPLRATIWKLDASGNRVEIVWDRYYGMSAPSSGYNCPNVNYCTQLAGNCKNPTGGICSNVVNCPDGSQRTQNGNCVTHDFNNQGQGDCTNLVCLCTTEGDPCPPPSPPLPPPGTGLVELPAGYYGIDFQECHENDPLNPNTGGCENNPCPLCSDGNPNNNHGAF